MKIDKNKAIGFTLLAAAGICQPVFAQTFATNFDIGPGAINTFSNVIWGGLGAPEAFGKDRVAALPGTSTLTLQFTLDEAVASFNLSFWASTNASAATSPIVEIRNSAGTVERFANSAQLVATGIRNPGNGIGTFFSLQFANPVYPPLLTSMAEGSASAGLGVWGGGAYTLTFSQSIGNGIRIDDVVLGAVPAVSPIPESGAPLLALAACGVVAVARRYTRSS